MKEKPTVLFPFFWAFLPDRISLATKDFIDFFYLQFYNIPHAEIPVIIPANSGKIGNSCILLLLLLLLRYHRNHLWFCLMQIGGYALSWA